MPASDADFIMNKTYPIQFSFLSAVISTMDSDSITIDTVVSDDRHGRILFKSSSMGGYIFTVLNATLNWSTGIVIGY